MKIIIAGGGIGGLVAALSLHKAGFEVKVFESVKEIKPLGVGINLLPHSVRCALHTSFEFGRAIGSDNFVAVDFNPRKRQRIISSSIGTTHINVSKS